MDRLAQQGDIAARYLFATWTPSFFGHSDAFLLEYEWASKAREYSFQNLEQAEFLGFLAFAESYSNLGYFTRQDINMAHAHYIAALECGFMDERWKQQIDYILSDKASEYRKDVRPQVLAMAEGLKGFCR